MYFVKVHGDLENQIMPNENDFYLKYNLKLENEFTFH